MDKKAIETLRVGQRVVTYLAHERMEAELPEPSTLEWSAYQVITLTLPCEDDQIIRVRLLRDPDWFRMHLPQVGGVLYLDMPEMGVEGDAIVESAEDCSEIEVGEGRVITATFHHSVGECLELDIEGEPEPLRVTAGHPIWRADQAADVSDESASSDCCSDSTCDCRGIDPVEQLFESVPELHELGRELSGIVEGIELAVDRLLTADGLHPNWVPAGGLNVGDSVSTNDGFAEIAVVRGQVRSHAVVNVEVTQDHAYRVGDTGILVHNTSSACDEAPFVRSEQSGSVNYDGRSVDRPEVVRAYITPESVRGPGERSDFNRSGPPWWSGLTDEFGVGVMERGHMVGSILGGPGDSEWWNMVPLYRLANHPQMSDCEILLSKYVSDCCQCLEVRVTAIYEGHPVVPDRLVITAKSDDRSISRRFTIHNNGNPRRIPGCDYSGFSCE